MVNQDRLRLPNRDWYGGWVLLLATLLGVALSPWQALTVLCLCSFAVLAWRWPDRALCLLPLTFPYWFVPRPLVGSAVFPLSELALGACLAAILARELPMLFRLGRLERLRSGVLVLRRRLGPWLVAGIAALALGLTLSLLVARMPRDALRAWRWEVAEPLLYLVLVLCYVRGRATVRWLIRSFLASALILALLAAVQVFWWHVTFTPIASGNRLVAYTTAGGGIPRASAIVFGSGNSLGAWMARALPLALAVLLAAGPLRRVERILLAVCLLAYVPALLWSASRGALVAAAVACVAVLVMRGRRPLLIGAAVLGVSAIALGVTGALAAFLAEHGGSAELRPLLWLAALHMIQDHPVLGIGMDQFLYYYSSRYTAHPYWITVFNGQRTNVWREPNLSHPHNLALELWLSGGPLALAGFALVSGNIWRRCLGLWHTRRDGKPDASWRAAVAVGLGASLLAGIVHGLVDSAYFAPDLALLFWWSVATLLVLEASPARMSEQARYKPRQASSAV
ncbi:MAG TPA: O-antigen ligase family protein [Ktedonobacterales bacterium]|nr:O-antigen ligase family protein [Ktedonobacterales bacterium]